MRVKVGCCGFPVSRGRYYKDFACVEVQQTFYDPPKEETLKKWRQEAPEDFEFTLKAWQLVTHDPKSPTYKRLKIKIPEHKKANYGFFKPTDEVFEAWEVTKRAAFLLKANFVVFQSPPSFKPTQEAISNLRAFFGQIDRAGLVLGWEPRGWPKELVRELCGELGLVHVVDPFTEESTWGEITYWRLHGRGGYNYQYSDEELKVLWERLEPQRMTYVMFNNTKMYEDALRFKEILIRGVS